MFTTRAVEQLLAAAVDEVAVPRMPMPSSTAAAIASAIVVKAL